MGNYLARLKQLVIRFRTVFCNISFRVGGQIAAKLLGLVSVPIIARALGPEMYGQWNEILLISQYALIPINFGFLAFGVRKIAQKDDPSATMPRYQLGQSRPGQPVRCAVRHRDPDRV